MLVYESAGFCLRREGAVYRLPFLSVNPRHHGFGICYRLKQQDHCAGRNQVVNQRNGVLAFARIFHNKSA